MSCGIFTTHYAINFGAILQAYSLQKAIENLGYECEVIDYRPPTKVTGRTKNIDISNVKSLIYSLMLFLNFKYNKEKKQKIEKFEQFLESKMVLSQKSFTSFQDVRNNLKRYDRLICGSDQIWNPNLFSDPAYYLRFEDIYPETRYISYAPSIATDLSDHQIHSLVKNIDHFDHISIREKATADLIRGYLNNDVKNVLDPVFLLTERDWANIEKGLSIDTPFILNYGLVSGKEYSSILKKLRKRLGMNIINIQLRPYNKFNAELSITDLSPENFLWLIRNANYVVTSSFHGTAFSILFNKQFVSIPANKRRIRIDNILELVGLDKENEKNVAAISNDEVLHRIQYDVVKRKLHFLIAESRKYLESSLCI